jgi:hypothetical protein
MPREDRARALQAHRQTVADSVYLIVVMCELILSLLVPPFALCLPSLNHRTGSHAAERDGYSGYAAVAPEMLRVRVLSRVSSSSQ